MGGDDGTAVGGLNSVGGQGTGGASGGTGGDGHGTGGGSTGGGSGGDEGSGGDSPGGSGGQPGGGGAPPGSGGNMSGTGGDGSGGGGDLLGGYHTSDDWAGFAFTLTDEGQTGSIAPADFDDLETDGPYCVTGTVAATEQYESLAAVGFNLNQAREVGAPAGSVVASGDGLMIHVTLNSGATDLRVQLDDGTDPTDPNAAQHRWCANLTVVDGEFNETLPWEAFSTECWAPGGDTDVPFDPTTELVKVIIYVPDPGLAGTTLLFDYCVNDIGPTGL